MKLNSFQKEALSSFFNNIAVAWFIAAFITPVISSEIKALTTLQFIVNMMGALYISLFLLKEERYEY